MKIKPLIAVVIIFIISVIGGTLAALYTNSVTLKNVFGTRGYHTDITEEFISPDDWTPGTTTDKKVFVENTGQVDAEVRISYKESWVSASGKQLSLKQGDNVAAIINFTDNGDWTKDGEYYYYNKVLKPGDKTTSFIDSVTFNSAIESDANCVVDGNTQTCTSSGDGYDGATYTLIIKVETIQASAKEEVWHH